MLISSVKNSGSDFKNSKLVDLKSLLKTLAENMETLKYFERGDKTEELKKLQISFDQEFISKIKDLEVNKENIKLLSSEMPIIKHMTPYVEDIGKVSSVLNEIKSIPSKMEEMEQLRVDMCISVDRQKGFYRRSQLSLLEINKLYNDGIKPKVEQVNKIVNISLVELRDGISKIYDAHIRAKYAYDSDVYIETEMMCIECTSYTTYVDPEYNADGSLKKRGSIVHHVPEPICHNVVDVSSLNINTRPTDSQVAQGVSKYLLKHPDIVGGSGSGLVPLTQEQVNQALLGGLNG